MPSSRLLTILRDRYYQWVPLSTRQKMRLSRILPSRLMPSTPPPTTMRVHDTPLSDTSPTGQLKTRPRVGIVIPTYNQLEQLKLCIGVLSWQTMKEYVIIVADDGSTDGTREWVKFSKQEPYWSNRLMYVSGGPHQGLRLSRAINLGVANLPADVWLLLLLSPDVLLHPFALETYLKWHSDYPNSLLIGRVDWLPAMERSDIQQIINTAGIDELAKSVPQDIPLEQVPEIRVGPEYRPSYGLNFADMPSEAESQIVRRGWVLTYNVALPPRLLWYVGGFDEQLCGAGYVDSDFAERLTIEGIEGVGVKAALGLHVHHERTDRQRIESQRNLDYMLRKFLLHGFPADIIQTYSRQTNWRYWWHYNRERGAEIVSPDGTLWAINGPRTHRLQLPDASWLTALGFARYEVHLIAPEELAAFEDMGVAADPLEDGLDYLRPPQKA